MNLLILIFTGLGLLSLMSAWQCGRSARKPIILAIFGLLGISSVVLLVFVLNHRTVYSSKKDPSGNYTAVFSYRTFLSFIPTPPGSGSDKPCFVKILNADGKSLGEVPVPIMQMAQVEWSPRGAEIKLVGEWNFETGACFYWSEDGEQKIFVRR